jgi:hypothetical protein
MLFCRLWKISPVEHISTEYCMKLGGQSIHLGIMFNETQRKLLSHGLDTRYQAARRRK